MEQEKSVGFPFSSSCSGNNAKCIALSAAVALLVVIIIALSVVVAVNRDKMNKSAAFAYVSAQEQQARRSAFMSQVQAANIKATMTEFSRYPHIAGGARNTELAQITADCWQSFGFDEVTQQRMPALLMKLKKRSVNVTSVDGTTVLYTCVLEENNVKNQERWSDALPPSNGYSGDGRAAGPVIWANFGRLKDYQALDALGVNFKGAIVVTRYGRIFRGNKVELAERRGAAGVIIAQDPGTVGPAQGPVFPDGPWAPDSDVQRGSISLGEGDPLTPDWPSQFGGPTVSLDDLSNGTRMLELGGWPLPAIPVQPMSWGDAKELLRNSIGAGGASTPLPTFGDWPDTGFRTQLGGFVGPAGRVEMEVRRDLQVFNITNVMGTIFGAVEPDRTVLFGSHRDAWTYGAVDPISAASITMEVARVLGGMHKAGWTPRRSIQVCSWDAEEWSIIGSTEYVETNVEQLRQRAVAYLNLDTAVTGVDGISAEGSPLLQEVFVSATKDVPIPPTKTSTSIENTNRTLNSFLDSYTSPGSGSDHVSFFSLIGCPVLDVGIYSSADQYEATYHSNYDSEFLVEKYIDPEFVYHSAMAKLWGNIVLRISEAAILPMQPAQYATNLTQWVDDYAKRAPFADFRFIQRATALLGQSAARHAQTTADLAAAIDRDPTSVPPLAVRAINDIKSGLERVFLATGNDGRETGSIWYKHVIYTPSAIDSYASTTMPLIANALATKDAALSNFAIGRVAQFIYRAAAYVNSTSVMPPNF